MESQRSRPRPTYVQQWAAIDERLAVSITEWSNAARGTVAIKRCAAHNKRAFHHVNVGGRYHTTKLLNEATLNRLGHHLAGKELLGG
jgi:hypothetical protein